MTEIDAMECFLRGKETWICGKEGSMYFDKDKFQIWAQEQHVQVIVMCLEMFQEHFDQNKGAIQFLKDLITKYELLNLQNRKN